MKIPAACLVVFTVSALLVPAGGTGAGEGGVRGRQTVLVHDVYELQNISHDLNASYALANDIDGSATIGWNGGKGFLPIEDAGVGEHWSSGDGSYIGVFNGELDGRGFKIGNLYMSCAGPGGLFLVINPSGRVSNLSLETVNMSGDSVLGALAAINFLGTVSNCHVSGKVCGTGPNADQVGMLVGQNHGTVFRCSSNGSVKGHTDIGGLVGTSSTGGGRWPGALLSDCFSLASVDAGNGLSLAGGLAGESSGTIRNCYGAGAVKGGFPGGLSGYSNGTVVGSFWDMESSGTSSSSGGMGVTTASMTKRSTFGGWDFNNIWMMEEGVSYPRLRASGTAYSLDWSDAPQDRILTEGDMYCETIAATNHGTGGAITYGLWPVAGAPTLFDDFDDSSMNASKWSRRAEGGVDVMEEGGRLVFRGTKTSGDYWVPQANVSSPEKTSSLFADLVEFSGTGTGFGTGLQLDQDSTTHIVIGAVFDPGDWHNDRPVIMWGFREDDVWYHFSLGELGPGPHRFGLSYQGGTGYYHVDGKLVMSKMIQLNNTKYRLFGTSRIIGDTINAAWDNVSGTPPGSLPANMTIDPSLGIIRWPDATTGNHSVGVTAADGLSSIWSAFNLTVEEKTTPPPVNRPPEIIAVSAPHNITVRWNETLTISAEASDPDGDSLTYEWRDNGITISTEQGFSRMFSPGDHALVLQIGDGRLFTVRAFNFTVAAQPVNQAPKITAVSAPDNTTVPWNNMLIISAEATDPDEDVLTCEWKDNGVRISTGWGFSQRFEPGNHTLELLIGDGLHITRLTFNFTVAARPANRPPEIVAVRAPGDRTIGWNETLTIIVEAMDPDGDVLTYEWKYNDVTIATGNSFSRRFVPGNHALVLLVGDGQHTIGRTFNYTVAPPPAVVETGPVTKLAIESGIAAAAIFSVVTIGVLLAAATEVGKYWLLPLLLLPLYTRLHRDMLLDNETRGMIRGCIISDPGIHYNEIQRRLNMGNGKAAYHLQALEREGIIKSRSDGRLRRFYPAEMRFDQAPVRLDRLQKLIFDFLREREGQTQREIAGALGISTPTVSRNMKRLAGLGVVRLERRGITVRCYIQAGALPVNDQTGAAETPFEKGGG